MIKRFIHLIWFLIPVGKEAWSAILRRKLKRGSGGHWYTALGEARHTMPKADGRAKGRKLERCQKAQTDTIGNYPARNVCRPGLIVSRINFRIAHDNPAQDGESYVRFANRCLRYEQPAEEAADFGTEVHDAIEKYHQGHIPDHLIEYIQPAID